jgi:hypothetical protein
MKDFLLEEATTLTISGSASSASDLSPWPSIRA